MITLLEENLSTALFIAIAMVTLLFAICLIAKLLRVAVSLMIAGTIISIVFAIIWGDGSAYIAKISAFVQPSYRQQIENAYDYYMQREAEDPIVDYDRISDIFTSAFPNIEEKCQWNAGAAANAP